MLFMNEDHLILRLSALCERFAKTALEGRYDVAQKAGLSEQYLYQILTGKPMANGNKRSLGKQARRKLSDAFPDWLEPASQPNAAGGEPGSIVAYTSTATREPAAPHYRPLVNQLCDVAEQIDDNALRDLIGYARRLAETNPFVKVKRQSSA